MDNNDVLWAFVRQLAKEPKPTKYLVCYRDGSWEWIGQYEKVLASEWVEMYKDQIELVYDYTNKELFYPVE